jgi:hypothetical protein
VVEKEFRLWEDGKMGRWEKRRTEVDVNERMGGWEDWDGENGKEMMEKKTNEKRRNKKEYRKKRKI